MIEVKNLHKGFGNVEILKGISTSFEAGKTNLIIGQSGSGKTVFLKSLVGLHTPEKGTIEFDGRINTKLTIEERRQLRQEIGMVFQGSALFDSQTVEENVMFPLKMFTKKPNKEMLERANFVLQRVDLVGSNKKYVAELSGGMQKRVAIARAIVMQPKYLFCDEPNSGLDPVTSIKIDRLLAEITEEYQITTVIVTHDMNSVMEIGEYIMFLSNSHKLWEGNSDEIMHSGVQELDEFVFANKMMRKFRDQQT